ncbi:wax ester/triacylglycerol synthase domain-containing protein [Agromyces arachidis]|uniref:wax ester/triacylglycerol synthase domain-containing protein n=1 Tax=Agromyces arachidis TaxID=766966 RepID=UPI004057B70F
MGAQRMPRERLSPADASNVEIDATDQVNAFAMVGVLGPGGVVGAGGALDAAALRAGFADRLHRAPRLAQRVVVERGAPTWESVDVDLERHVRVVAPVDGRRGLAALCARLMVTPLAPDRPLWELLLVPGAAPRGVGVVLRLHHAIADGIGAVRLVERLLAEGPEAPSGPGDAVGPAAARPAGAGSPVARARGMASGIARTTTMLRRAVPDIPLLGPIGPNRGVAFLDAELGPVAAGARGVGATVNDALLAAVARGAEAALAARGSPVPAVLPVSVPVALPGRGRSGNAVGVMLVPLPTGEPDAATRMRRIAELTRDGKADARERGTFELTRRRSGARLFARLARHQHAIAAFVTDVPGPRHPLAIAGAPLERAWPLTPIQGNVRLGVSALSYAGRLGVGVHSDAGAVPAAVVADAIRAEFDRIAALG